MYVSGLNHIFVMQDWRWIILILVWLSLFQNRWTNPKAVAFARKTHSYLRHWCFAIHKLTDLKNNTVILNLSNHYPSFCFASTSLPMFLGSKRKPASEPELSLCGRLSLWSYGEDICVIMRPCCLFLGQVMEQKSSHRKDKWQMISLYTASVVSPRQYWDEFEIK